MESVITALKDTPIPTILVVAGIVFLLLSIAGQLAGRIAVAPERQRSAAIIGGLLVVIGIALHVAPPLRIPSMPPKVPPPVQPEPATKGKSSPPSPDRGESTQPPPPPPKIGEIQLSSLNARLTALRFFEGHPCEVPSLEQRTYRERFSKKITRDIFTEITLEYPKHERRLDFTIQAVYQRKAHDGEVVSTPELRTYIPADRESSIHWFGSDRERGLPVHCRVRGEPGRWSIGSYTVDVFINGENVASGSFEVHD